jgi:hypothetical protein
MQPIPAIEYSLDERAERARGAAIAFVFMAIAGATALAALAAVPLLR